MNFFSILIEGIAYDVIGLYILTLPKKSLISRSLSELSEIN